MTLVLYFFQGELGESEELPNAFMSKSTGSMKFSTFLSEFPLSKGQYHYRFKTDDATFGYVWKDITSLNEDLPYSGGVVTAKILRLADCHAVARKNRLKKKQNYETNPNLVVPSAVPKKEAVRSSPMESRASPSPAAAPSPVATPLSVPQTSPPAAAPSPPIERKQSFDFFQSDAPPPSPAPRPASAPSAPGIVVDDIDDDVPAQAAAPLSRDELRARREANVQERVQEALKFKQELDENTRREEEDLDSFKRKHDKNLTAWAANNNEKRNVRTLLSTMHTVLWPDSGWTPISLADVIESKRVKLQYRKAMLVVHPDRCSNRDSEIRFIAKRIFEAINEAYQEFLKKEGL